MNDLDVWAPRSETLGLEPIEVVPRHFDEDSGEALVFAIRPAGDNACRWRNMSRQTLEAYYQPADAVAA